VITVRRNPALEAIVRELRAAGIKPSVEEGGKHLLVRWLAHNGRRLTLTVSRSGSREWRAPRNAGASVRRALRQDAEVVRGR
jgi:hypothetical protein